MRLIDADKLLEKAEWFEYYIESEAEEIAFMYVDVENVENAPTIDPESLRPRGRWGYYSTTMQECSNCKRHTPRHRYAYCPHCGAKMEGRG